jgi:hypothetical protein
MHFRPCSLLLLITMVVGTAVAQRTDRLARDAGAMVREESADTSRATLAGSALPRVIRYSGTAPEQAGNATVTFAIYDEIGSTPLWTESQVVSVSGGKFSALLGAMSNDGLPPEIFSGDQARWLSVSINGAPAQKSLLVSVPYAMKALEAERIAGRTAEDLVSTDQLEAAVKRAISGKSAKVGPETSSAPGADSPATDFTDSNATEVLLVTQNGTGYSINAAATTNIAVRGVSSAVGAGAVQGENAAAGGVGAAGFSTAVSGLSIGVLGQSVSPTGRGVRGVVTDTTGANVGVQGQTSSSNGIAVQGDNLATTGIALGVRGVTNSTAGKALAGLALASTGTSTAIDGQNASNAGIAIFANASSTSGSTFGLLARVNSPNGTAARFESSSAAATATLFSGISNNVQRFIVKGDGHLITLNQFTDGIAIEGNSTLTGNHFGYGVVGATKSNFGSGVNGTTTAAGNALSSGVQGFVTGTAGVGVWGEATNTVAASTPIGVYGVANNATATGGVFENKNAGGRIADFFSNGSSVAFIDASGFHGSGANLTSIPGSAIVGAVTGPSATATALAANGSNCAAGQYAAGVDAGGNAEGCSTDGSALTNLTAANIASGIAAIDISGNAATATTAASAASAATATDASNLGGVPAASYALTTYVDTQDALDAKLGAGNTFTAGTQDFSGAAATLPIRSVNSLPVGLCSAEKEMVILQGGTVNQQVYLCNAAGNGWDVVGSSASGTVTSVDTGAGLTGGPITSTGTISIATSGVTNAMLANSSLTVTAGTGMSGGGSVSLGGMVTLDNAGVTGLAGTANQISASAATGAVTLSFPSAGVTLPGKTTLTAAATGAASLNVPSGTAPTTPNSGDVWNESGSLKVRTSSSTNTIASSPAAFSININPLGALNITKNSCAVDSTVAVADGSLGDPVVWAIASDSANTTLPAGLLINMWVSANGTVSMRMCNGASANISLAAGTAVIKLSGRVLKY